MASLGYITIPCLNKNTISFYTQYILKQKISVNEYFASYVYVCILKLSKISSIKSMFKRYL